MIKRIMRIKLESGRAGKVKEKSEWDRKSIQSVIF